MEYGNLNPACLPPGTQVGPWRVLELLGQGTYGAVYRAESMEPPASGHVALKLALSPRDARFAREVELLSRLRHPHVPRLLDYGPWRHLAGTLHPYLVMELIEGLPLYDWAREHRPSSRQVLQLLVGLARALEATHAVGGVHRDVKGDNVLVRVSDGRPFLTDFGSSTYQGASTLTWQTFPPGTPAYRSPEALHFALRFGQGSAESYAPRPADDVFALGVTAYRLVTQEYPPSTNPLDDEFRPWNPEDTGPRPARDLNASCCPELSGLIARMLSPAPEARGSARELAKALEQAARCSGPEADMSLFIGAACRPPSTRPVPPHAVSRTPRRVWRPWPVAAGLGGALVLAILCARGVWPEATPGQERVALEIDLRDGGTVAVGDSVLTAPEESAHSPPSAWSTVAEDLPPKPLPGQLRPDANGRCPRRMQLPIRGGCWMKLDVALKDCDEEAYVYKGGCYTPVFPPGRPATSSPASRRDGG